MAMRTIFALLFSIIPSILFGQTTNPNWLEEDYRTLNYPTQVWYSGFAMDKIGIGEQLMAALQRVENSARNKLVEQIQVSIESSSSMMSSSSSITTNAGRSERIAIDYRQDIHTTTNASAVGVEVKSHFDSNNNIVYAFAYVDRDQLATYYIHQEEAIFEHIESELTIIDDLIDVGQKITAQQRCEQLKAQLQKAADYRLLISAVKGSETAYSDRLISLSEVIDKRLLSLQQSTKVFVLCEWKCANYPQYGNIAEMVKESVETLLTTNNCTIVTEPSASDYCVELTLSTTQRSDGSDEYGIISYYANLTGKMINMHTRKQVVNISLIQDPRLYSAGKNESQAISKAFRSQRLSSVLKDIIVVGLEK